MGDKADQLAQEMSRFEQEILDTAPKPLFTQKSGPPHPPTGGPPPGPPHLRFRGPPPGPPPGPPGPPQELRGSLSGIAHGPPPPAPQQRLGGPSHHGMGIPPPGRLGGPPPGPIQGLRGPPPGPSPPRPPVGGPPHHLGNPSLLTPQLMPQPTAPQAMSLQSTPMAGATPAMMQPPLQVGAEASAADTGAFPVSKKPLKSMKMKRDPKKLRMGGGRVWEDHTLDDWDQDDFRIFVGDLGNDVNDDTLARSFSKYQSFLKAKVIRDKYTKKTKGYGFVSFKTPQDFMQAMREMNGKYIGNRPVKLRKSTWKDCAYTVVKKKEKEKKRLGFR